tara:strand:- start:12544 stop:13107 length:564 start_codon:yes stop_codon:yes gene_type:complete
MSISRRQFLLSTAGAVGGFILPSFYHRALEFLDQFGEPLLEAPKLIVDELIICSEREGELNLGDPWEQPPEMSWRELLTRYKPETLDNVEDDWEITESQLDDQADWDWVIYFWCRSDSPNARAYRLLDSLDLGPVLTGQKAVGGLVFTDGPCPGNDYLGVAVEDEISASLLQKRLSDLNTGIKVKYI